MGFTRTLVSNILSLPEFVECEFARTDIGEHNIDLIRQPVEQIVEANRRRPWSPPARNCGERWKAFDITVPRAIRTVIEGGGLEDDDALPPERDLAKALGVSRVTVRSAIRRLVDDGMLVQRRGAGTFVSRRIEVPLTTPTSFTEDMWARGLQPDYEMLDRHTGPATPRESDILNPLAGDEVTRLYRVRNANRKPMCLESTSVSAEILPERAAFTGSLYAFLSEKGMRPLRAVQRLRAVLLEMEQARPLHVAPGSAGLFVEQQSFLDDGRPVEYVRSYYRGDAYDFVAELNMPGARHQSCARGPFATPPAW